MKLLCICDPALYPTASMDVPTLYRKLASDPQVELFHAPVEHILYHDRVEAIAINDPIDHADFQRLNQRPSEMRSLSDFDLVFCRRLKPFPEGYLELLSQWETQVPFLNRPSGKIQQVRSEFFPRVAKDWSPDQIVTDQVAPLAEFLERYHTIVAKRANSCGGRGVFKLWQQGNRIYLDHFQHPQQIFESIAQALTYLMEGQSEPIQFVRFLNKVTAGDKRIVVVDGEIYGAYLRKSRRGHWVNNVSADADCTLAEITLSERVAIEQTVEAYQALGLHTLGYDFLMGDDGHWILSEINAGNIGGFARLEALTGEPICDRFIRWMLTFAATQSHLEPCGGC